MRRTIRPTTVLLIGCLAIAASSAVAADRDPSESASWLDLSARAKLAPGTGLTLTQILRWDDSFDQLGVIAPELSLRQRLRSWWRIEGGYRYMRERDNDGLFQHRHRAFANTRFRVRTSAATLELRVQWQEEFRHELDDGTPRRHVLRTRAKMKARGSSGITPYASLEAFHRLDGGDDDVPSGTRTKMRFVAGAEWGRGPVEYNARYLLVVPVHEDTDPLRHVVSFGMRFDLPL